MDTFRPVSDRRCYLVHGLVVASSVVLPLPTLRSRAADVIYRVDPAVGRPRVRSFSLSKAFECTPISGGASHST